MSDKRKRLREISGQALSKCLPGDHIHHEATFRKQNDQAEIDAMEAAEARRVRRGLKRAAEVAKTRARGK